jgi:uncharacterized membrane protein YkvA (DUF1232 family)
MKRRGRRLLPRRRASSRGLARSLVRELPKFLKLIVRLLRDPRVAVADRVLFGAVLIYVIAPIDLVPDFLVGLGLVDDLYLMGLAFARLLGRAGRDVLLEHWDGDPRLLGHFIEAVEDVGGLLPRRVRRVLGRAVRADA